MVISMHVTDIPEIRLGCASNTLYGGACTELSQAIGSQFLVLGIICWLSISITQYGMVCNMLLAVGKR